MHVHVHVPPKRPCCYSSTTRHSAMVPTAASPSAQPAIVKIRRVDALIIIILLPPAASTPTIIVARLYALAALLLLRKRAAKYSSGAPSGALTAARLPRRRRAFATPPPRCRAAAVARLPLHSRLFKFTMDKIQLAFQGQNKTQPAEKVQCWCQFSCTCSKEALTC